MKMEHTECSETLAHKIQTPGNHPKERIQHSEHGEGLNLEKFLFAVLLVCKGYTVFDNIVQMKIQMSSCAASLKLTFH